MDTFVFSARTFVLVSLPWSESGFGIVVGIVLPPYHTSTSSSVTCS